MLWTWLAVVIAGVGGAGVFYALARLFNEQSNARTYLKRLAPLSAGACMLASVIVGEYQWASHQKSQLPKSAKVVTEVRPVSAFKPWTWFAPSIQRFSALDISQADFSPIIRADVYLLSRWQSPVMARQWFDCAQYRRANSAAIADARPPELNTDWTPLKPDDAYLQAACQSVRN